MNRPANITGYSRVSIALHWLSAIAVVALFLTHEGERGGAANAFHVGGGALLGPFLLWRFVLRFRNGTAKKPAQAEAFNLFAHIVMWAMLAAIALTVVTGYLLPWSLGRPLDIYGLIIPAPISRVGWLHEAIEAVHTVCGQALLPLVVLHLAGVAKHFLFDADRLLVLRRMLRPLANGL